MNHRVPADPTEHLRIAFMAGAYYGAAYGWGRGGHAREPMPLPPSALLEAQWLQWFGGAHDHLPELVSRQPEPSTQEHLLPPLGDDPWLHERTEPSSPLDVRRVWPTHERPEGTE